MKTLAALVLCALCACASAYDIDMEPSTNSLSKVRENFRNRKRKIVANRPLLTDEERKARRRKAAESRRIDKTKERKEKLESITAKFAAAKAACPDCYRVVVTNGVYVGMTKPQYDAYISEKDENAKRERKEMELRKHRKHAPGSHPRHSLRKNRRVRRARHFKVLP